MEPGTAPAEAGAEALAQAIIGALKDGVEDVYPGDVAESGSAAGKRIRRSSSAN